MSREKQIAEMARGMCLLSARLKCSECSDNCQYYDFAERLYKNGYRKASDVAADIFAEIEEALSVYAYTSKSVDYSDGADDVLEWVDSNIVELKKKRIESEGVE